MASRKKKAKSAAETANPGSVARTQKGVVTRDYCDRFKNTPTRQLAEMLAKEHPLLFFSYENARSMVRYYRGKAGWRNRNFAVEVVDVNVDGPRIPPSSSENWEPFQLPLEDARWLIVADWHVPFHDEKACTRILEHGKDEGCNNVLFLGDMIDCHELSSFEKKPTERKFREEVDIGKKMLDAIAKYLDPEIFVWKLGNHEERYYRYLYKHAPAIYGVEDLDWGNVFDLEERGIILVGDQRPVVVDNQLFMMHGHEYSRNMLSPVNPARGVFLRGHECAVTAHSHVSSNHSEPTFSEKVISCWSIGCGCNLHPAYCRMNRWTHGHGTLALYNGKWAFNNWKIVKGRVTPA